MVQPRGKESAWKTYYFLSQFYRSATFYSTLSHLIFYSFPLSLLKAHQKQWKERNFLLAFRKWVLFLYFMMVDERRGLGIMRTRVWFAWQFDRHGSWKIASKTHIEMLAANNIHNKQSQFFLTTDLFMPNGITQIKISPKRPVNSKLKQTPVVQVLLNLVSIWTTHTVFFCRVEMIPFTIPAHL